MPRKYNRSNLWKRPFLSLTIETTIKPIFRFFIEPLLDNLPMSPESLLHLWFNTGDRRLYFAVVKKAIKIPGYVRHPVTNQEYVPAAELREAKKGEQLTVRFDLTRPSLIEVEYNEVVFRMNQLQWSNIAGDVAFVG